MYAYCPPTHFFIKILPACRLQFLACLLVLQACQLLFTACQFQFKACQIQIFPTLGPVG